MWLITSQLNYTHDNFVNVYVLKEILKLISFNFLAIWKLNTYDVGLVDVTHLCHIHNWASLFLAIIFGPHIFMPQMIGPMDIWTIDICKKT